MRLGYFDHLDRQIYTNYGLDKLNTPEHRELALVAAREGIVLLENREHYLPTGLAKHKIAVMGPFANDTRVMLGNYEGIPETITSIFAGIQAFQPDTILASGCEDVFCNDPGKRQAAIQQAKNADLIILAVGIDQSIEREGLDRESLLLPEGQRALIDQVLADLQRPVILALFSGGGSQDVSEYTKREMVKAILQVGYAGMYGGQAFAEIVNGDVNPSGRLVNTWYYEEFVQSVDFFDMAMRSNPTTHYPGRTYRFFTEKSQYPFGYGLSYTQFTHHVSIGRHPSQRMLRFNHRIAEVEVFVRVKNVGERDGEESVLLFLKSPQAGHRGYPLKTLAGFERVFLKVGEEKEVKFLLTTDELRLTNEDAKFEILSGTWTALVEESSALFVL